MRLLVVTYYFPPSGGAGVQRPLKWVKYLPSMGVEPVVLTVRAGAYPHLDESLLADIPEDVAVERTAAPDPFGLYGRATGRSRDDAVQARTGRVGESPALAERGARWIRANLFVPDARVGWVPFALRRAEALHAENPFDAVLTTGPPHSVHLVGRGLHRKHGVPWLADFRDPWSDIHYIADLQRSDRAQRLDERLERSVLLEADAVVTVSEPLRRSLQAKAGDTPVFSIRNGFDPSDFAHLPPEPKRKQFEILYTGTLYTVPENVLEGVAALREQDDAEIRLRFVGSVPPDFPDALARHGLTDVVSVEPAVRHDEAIRLMRGASVLLLTIKPCDYADAVIPGKTFEYLAARRPILGIGPPDGEAADILRDAGAGEMLHWSGDVVPFLQKQVAAWRMGFDEVGPSNLEPFSRVAQTREVARILTDLSAARVSGPAR